jgi:hypothetical protein
MIMRFINRWDSDVSIWIDLSSIVAISSDQTDEDFEVKLAMGSQIDDDACFCVCIPQEGEETHEDALKRLLKAWVSARLNRRV